MELLTCSKCKASKPETDFSIKRSSRTGRNSKCKKCHNDYVRDVWYVKNKEKHKESQRAWKQRNPSKVLANSLGVDISEAQKMVAKGKLKCDICGKNEDLHYDHCHKLGKARGVLCIGCNTLIGRLGDDSETVRARVGRIIEYLDGDFLCQ